MAAGRPPWPPATPYFVTDTPSTVGSSCPSSATSNRSRITSKAAVTTVATCPGSGRPADAYGAPSIALLEEHSRAARAVSCGYWVPASGDDAAAVDLGMLMLGSPHQELVFQELIKISLAIHQTHRNIASLCRQVDLDASFGPKALSACNALRSLTSISEAVIAPHPDNLFVVMSMFEPLNDLFSIAKESLFPAVAKERIFPAVKGLSQAAANALLAAEFDNALLAVGNTVSRTLEIVQIWISDYTSDEVPQGGGIHEITRYIMNYVMLLSEHSAVLSIVQDISCGAGEESKGEPRMKTIMMDLISCLVRKLQKLSQSYQDAALGWMFLVNNMHFIGKQQQETSDVFGEDDLVRSKDDIQFYISRYLDVSWAPILSCLHTKSRMIPVCYKQPAISRFSAMFEKTYGAQKNWKVENPLLRKHMRLVIIEMLMPTYRSFLQKQWRKTTMISQYPPKELKELLLELFEG
ncbi:hypothetical protein ACP4OV_021796 [Aristida adscensionis]